MNRDDESVAELRERIEQTRSQMTETIDVIQERLSPAYIKEQLRERVKTELEEAKETVREAAVRKVESIVQRTNDAVDETRRKIMPVIKANQFPLALIGAGLCWMWWNGRKSSGNTVTHMVEQARESVNSTVGQVQEKVGDLTGRARETLSTAIDRAQETAGHLTDQAQQQVRRVEDGFQTAMKERPLAVGAVALAVGAAVGLMIPQTRKENEILGEAREKLADRAQSAVEGVVGQVHR
jgi:ElaB/YqjD/DUF883 family membrane-anchored ribosome-binding protein